jgi:hypothetical protein
MPEVWLSSWRTVACPPGAGKSGRNFGQRIVERDLALVHQLENQRGRELLRNGSEPEHRGRA